jgi:rRNA maturation RNase YbeY
VAGSLEAIAASLAPAESRVDLIVVTDDYIRSINRDYRDIDRPTDVISFSYIEDDATRGEVRRSDGAAPGEVRRSDGAAPGEVRRSDGAAPGEVRRSDGAAPDRDDVAGEIYVSRETLERDATSEGVDLDHLFLRIGVHGLLHILGYDHETDEDAERMEKEERKLLGGCLTAAEVSALFQE